MADFQVFDSPPPKAPTSEGGFAVFDSLPEGVKAKKKPGMAEDVVKSIPGAIPRAAAGLVDLFSLPHRAQVATVNWVAENVFNKRLDIPQLPLPSEPILRGVDKAYDAVTGGEGGIYKPQTGAGRIADFTTQMVATGGSMAPRAIAQGLVSGVAGGGAGELARTVSDNPWVVGGAQVAGALAGAAPFMLRGVPAANIDKALRNVTPEQMAQAQSLMDRAASMGTPITGAEAIAQVTGKNTLQDIQRVVEQSPKGGSVLQNVMNARPEANRSAFTAATDEAAGAIPATPSRTPVALQEAAAGAITDARRSGNAAAKEAYDAARQNIIPEQQWMSLVEDPAVKKALSAVRTAPEWGAAKAPPGSIEWLDSAKRWLDSKLQARDITPSEARIWQGARDKIVQVADAESPAYEAARQIVARNRREVVQPMVESPVGDLAKTKGMPLNAEQLMTRQSEVLMPTAPRALDPQTIRTAVQQISAKDPEAARAFVRQNLEAIFSEATQANVGGANQWGGAKFAAQIAGNPAQEKNLAALIDSASGKGTYAGFRNFLEVMEAQGKRHAPGSMTEFNRQTAGALSSAGAGAVPAAAVSPGRASTLIYDWYQNFRYGKNTQEMAKILTDPDSVMLMKELARTKPDTALARMIAGQIVTQAAPKDESPNR